MSDTELTQLVINELTREQYDALTPRANQLYLVTDDDGGSTPTNMVTTDTAQTITGTKTFTTQTKFQSGVASGCVRFGADLSANTLTANTRKLARLVIPQHENPNNNLSFVSIDTTGDGGSGRTIGNTTGAFNSLEFGSRKGDTTGTAPDGIFFCCAKIHNTTSGSDKQYVLEMNHEQARFDVQPNYLGKNLATEEYVDNMLGEIETLLSEV